MKKIYKFSEKNVRIIAILTILYVKTVMPNAVFSQLSSNPILINKEQFSLSDNLSASEINNKLTSAKSDSMINLILKTYKQKVYFTQNAGQMPDSILYKADFKLGQALVTKKGMVVGIFDTASISAAVSQSERREKVQKEGLQFNEAPVPVKGHGWYMKFKNSLPGMTLVNKTKYKEQYNYFIGNDKSKYTSNVSNFGEVYYQNVYKNTDVRYYPSADGSLEYDIICKPGADPKNIELQFEGIDKLSISNGKLRIKTSVGELDFPAPYTYQMINGKEKKVNCSYNLNKEENQSTLKSAKISNNTITFNVSDYDHTQPLVIDPIALRWATWISNNASINSHGHGIWVDPISNNIYVTGWYQTTGLITVGAFQNTNAGSVNLFVGCYTQPTTVGGTGTRVWQTFLGGNDIDNPYALEMGSDGNLYIAGITTSSNYPLVGGSAFSGTSIDKRSQSGQNIFVTKMNSSGTSFKSSVIGGNQDDYAYDVRIANNGEVLVCGYTQSTNLSTLFTGSGASNTNSGGTDVLLFRLSSDLSTLRWMKNYGGSSNDQANIMLTNPNNGDIFVGGQTASSNFPTLKARQSSRGGTQSGFLMKLNSAGSTKWSSYYKASTGSTSVLCMEFNAAYDKIYFGGLTSGLYTGNVSTTGVYSSAIKGGVDFFVCLMDTAQTFQLGTYIGSSGTEYNMMGLNVDQNNDVYIFGYTPGTNYPVTSDALQTLNLGNNNKVFTKIKSDLSSVVYSTYFGGTSDDYDPVGERGIKFSNCRIYTIVTASSNDIPLTQGAVTTNKLSSTSILEPGLVIWSNPPDLSGNVVTGTQTICNGNIPSTITGSTASYILPTITRNGVLLNYPAITPTTTYQWQSSIDSLNWNNVTGGNTTNLAGALIGALSQKTYFRRIINGDACSLPGASGVTINVDKVLLSGTPSNVTCYGYSNGSIALSAFGGKTPYTYKWSNGLTTQNLSNVVAGTYTVTVTDAISCSGFGTYTISQPNQIQINFTTIAPSCGLPNGSITATASNAFSPYSYLWNTSASTQTISNTYGGVYNVTVTDATGCKLSAQSYLTTSTTCTINGTVINEYCNGGNIGAITLSVSGGASPYSYIWSDGANVQNRTSLYANKYAVEVIDNANCISVQYFTVTQPVFSVSTTVSSHVTCYAGNNGSVTSSITGGISPFSYLWSNSSTTSNISGLTSNVYFVTVTDSHSCKQIASANVLQPTQVTAAVSVVDTISCYNAANGLLQVYANGGVSPYTYLWSNAANTVTIGNLNPATYRVTVTDASSCKATGQLVLSQPSLLSITTTYTTVCNVSNSCIATAIVSGGTSPYLYAWSTTPVQTSASAPGLAPGTYTVIVTDKNGCTASSTVNVIQTTSLSLNTSKTNVLCYGNSDGTATVASVNGVSPYNYIWNTSPAQYSATVANLAIGTYKVTVTDINSCKGSINVTITQPSAALSSTITSQINIFCYGNSLGSATSVAAGGTTPYTYIWNTSPAQTAAIAYNLPEGTYTLTVTDNNGCKATSYVTMKEPLLIHTSYTTFYASANSGTATTLWLNIHTKLTSTQLTNNGDYILFTGGVLTLTGITGSAGTVISIPNGELIVNSGATKPTTSYNSGTNTWITQVPPAYTSTDIFLTGIAINSTNGYTVSTGKATTVSGVLYTNKLTFTSTWFYGLSCYQPTFTNTTIGTVNSVSGIPVSGRSSGTPTTQITHIVSGGSGTGGTNYTGSYSSVDNFPAALDASISAQTNILCFGNTTGSATINPTGGTSPYSYSWNTSPVQTNATATNLSAGTYTVIVTDKNGCKIQSGASISQPGSLTASISSQTNILCYGNSTGSATVLVSGGVSPYTYLWSNAQTTSSISNLQAGIYTVTVTDNNGCNAITTASIIQPDAPLNSSFDSQTNILCYGSSTGSVNLNVSGGSSPYTYLWSNGQTISNISNLSANIYSVTVTDNNACKVSSNVTITQPVSLLNASITSQSNILCNGYSTGSVTLTATGGTTPYNYLWSNGSNLNNLSNLQSGSYTVTVTDNNLCLAFATLTITQPAPLVANLSAHTDVSCFGNSNGLTAVIPSGGVSPYSYYWNTSPVQTASIASNLPAGNYSVTITDNSGCKAFNSATISQPAALSPVISSLTNVLCFGNTTGSVAINPTGGTSPFTYLWSNSSNLNNMTNLQSGIYSVTVTDSHNCKANTSVTVTQPATVLSASIDSKVNVLCYGNSTGSANVTAIGGTTPYNYLWSNTQTSSNISNLNSNIYIVTVTDNNGCIAGTSVTITQPASALSASIASQANVLCYGNNNGSAAVTAAGGSTPYNYLWSNAQASSNISNLTSDNYTVTIIDNNGCKASSNVTITQPAAPLSASVTSQSNVSCFGNSTGSATVTATGGSTPYSYLWSNNSNLNNLTNLQSGIYSVTVTDSHSCKAVTTVNITQPSAPLAASVTSQTNILCYGNNSGSASITATGGTTPYTYLWNNGQTISNISNLTTNIYIVTVTDNNGCIANANVTITQPVASLSASITSQNNIMCYGNSTGSATVTVTGGSTPYNYLWSDNSNMNNLANLQSGNYAVTVTDNNGCKVSSNVTISEPVAPLSASINSKINVACYGNSTGSATVTATGGSSPYSYLWSDNSNLNILTNLQSGIYSVTVTDNHSCKAVTTVTITQPSAPLLAPVTSQTNILCYGNSSGSATVTSSGGTSPYTYLWSNNSVLNNLSNMQSGIYFVTVTDNNNCKINTSVTITQPSSPLTSSVTSHTNVLCYGNNTGSASVTVSGGTSPYAYLWSNNFNLNNITNLKSGIYFVTITDNNGCKAFSNVTVSQPASALLASVSSQFNVLCNGNNTGSASVTVAGGTTPYTYIWNNGQQSTVNSSLSAGNYSITISDNNSCQYIKNVTITQPPQLTAKLTSTPGICNSSANGTVVATPSGGTSPYTYKWNNGSNLNNLANLQAGIYSVTVSDHNGCNISSSTNILQYFQPTVSINRMQTNICPGTSVTFTALTTGSVNLSYQWYKQIFPITNATISSYSILSAGISDANQYYCIVKNTCGTAQSSLTYLSVINFSITSQPSNSITHSGGSAIFNIVVSDNNSTYQWQQNGVNIYDNSVFNGTQTSQLYIADCPASFNNYSYRCIVIGSQCGNSIISNSGVLTVNTFPVSGLWIGSVSDDWQNPANWDDNTVPLSNTNVIIQCETRYQPVIYSTDSVPCHNLTIKAGASLLVTDGGFINITGAINIKSDLRGDGTFDCQACHSFNLQDTATVEKFLAIYGYHYITSPMQHTSLQQINKTVKLVNLGYGYYDPNHPPTAAKICNIWFMVEPHSKPNDPTDQNSWLAPSTVNDIMLDMRGYALNDATNNVTITFTGKVLNNCSISTTLTHLGNGFNFVGNPYTAPVDWNLIFNDLSPHINGTMIFFNRTSLWYGAWAYYNPMIGTWGAFQHSQYIPAMQGFYLYCDSTAVLTFTPAYKTVAKEAMRTTMTKKFDKASIKYPLISFKAYSSSLLEAVSSSYDQSVIYFVPDATETTDMKYDAVKMMNSDEEIPNIYTVSDNKYFAINALPLNIIQNSGFNIHVPYTIPFNFKVTKPGKYILKVEDFMNFEQGITIYLIDTKENVTYELAQGRQLTFNLTNDNGVNRFFLKFSLASSNNEPLITNNELFSSWSDGSDLFVNYLNPDLKPASLNIYSLDGRLVNSKVFVNGNSLPLNDFTLNNGNYRFNSSLPQGIYFVKLTSDTHVYIKKVYLN